MKGRLSPRILAAPLLIALIVAPSIMQEGLLSLRWAPLWMPWGIPALAATGVFAILAGAIRAVLALAWACAAPRQREPESPGESEPATETGGREEEAAGDEIGAETEPEDGTGPALYEALDELDPENYMDLVRALQEMERHGEALEVLARIAEMQEGERSEEFARALRRAGHQWRKASPPGA